MKDESLDVVREILDLMISQCQNFKDSFSEEQNDMIKSNNGLPSSDTISVIMSEKPEKTENRPVIRLANFAVDPSFSSEKTEEKKNSIITNQKKKMITTLMEARLDKVTVGSPDKSPVLSASPSEPPAYQDVESHSDNPTTDEFAGLSMEIDLKTDILEDIDDKQIMTIDLSDENLPSTSSGVKKETDLKIETIDICDDDDDEKSSAKSKTHNVCFKYMEHEKFSLYNLRQRSPKSRPEPYIILTSSVEAENIIATKLFISKSKFDQIEGMNFGDWVWLMAKFTFSSDDRYKLSTVRIELQGVLPLTAFIPKDIDEVEHCIQSKANFVLSKKRFSHILNCCQNISHRICHNFMRHGKAHFVNCSEALGLEWIGRIFEYDDTVFRRNKLVKQYPQYSESYISNIERSCKRKVLEKNFYNFSDLSDSNARIVDNIVGKLEVMIREKLDGATIIEETELQNPNAVADSGISNKEPELQTQVRNNTEEPLKKASGILTKPTENDINLIDLPHFKKNSKIPATFICPQVHKHNCSETFTFTSHEDVMTLLDHLDIPVAVRNRQYKLLKERLRAHPKDTLFKDCFYNKNKNNKNSSLFYLFCDAKTYGDIVSEDMLAAVKKKCNKNNMKRNLIQYMNFLEEKEHSSSTSASIDLTPTSTTEEETTSPSVPLLQFFQCPQKYQHSCRENFALQTFKDVSIMLQHLEIPKIVIQNQHGILNKVYQSTITSCPFCNCNLLIRDGFYHFEHVHYLVSSLIYLYTEAKLYGDKVTSGLLSLIREVLPEDMKYHLDMFLNFQQKNKSDQSPSIKDHQAELSPTTEVSTGNTSEKSSSSSFVMHPCPQKDKHKCSKMFAISCYRDVVELADHLDIPPKAMGYQIHHLYQMAKEDGKPGNQCPLSSCQLLNVNAKNVVNHFILNHQVESTIFYLFWDAKDYGESYQINLLSSIKLALPTKYKTLLADYLNFIQSKNNVLKESITVPKVQIMISDEARFDIEVLETNPVCAESLPSSSSSKSSRTNATKNGGSKKKKSMQNSQTRGVVTDVELDKIIQKLDKEVQGRIKGLEKKRQSSKKQQQQQQKFELTGSSQEPSSQVSVKCPYPDCEMEFTARYVFWQHICDKHLKEELLKYIPAVPDQPYHCPFLNCNFVTKDRRQVMVRHYGMTHKVVHRIVGQKFPEFLNNDPFAQSPKVVARSKPVIPRYSQQVQPQQQHQHHPQVQQQQQQQMNLVLEEDEDDPAEVNFENDDVISISPDPSKPAMNSNKISAEPKLVRSQTFTSFDEMLGITEERTLKRKHEEDNKGDPWKRLKSSDTQSMVSDSTKSFHRYILYH